MTTIPSKNKSVWSEDENGGQYQWKPRLDCQLARFFQLGFFLFFLFFFFLWLARQFVYWFFAWAMHNHCYLLQQAVERSEGCISLQKSESTNLKSQLPPQQCQATILPRSNGLKTWRNALGLSWSSSLYLDLTTWILICLELLKKL